MMSDVRRERQLGWVTPNQQRYDAKQAADWLDAIKRQLCPFCGSGPFTVVALHVERQHGINRRELSDMLGITYSERICDEAYSKTRAELGRHPTNLERLAEVRLLPRQEPTFSRVVKWSRHPRDESCPLGYGNAGGYTNHGCRCEACTAANAENHHRYMQSRIEQQEKQRARSRAGRRRQAEVNVEYEARRLEVLRLTEEGLSRAAIARQLGISEAGVTRWRRRPGFGSARVTPAAGSDG